MAYCSSCKGTIHGTTKVCPHCGGNFDSIFGPIRSWGTYKPPPPPLSLKERRKRKERAEEEKRQRKERAEEEKRQRKERREVERERVAALNIHPDKWSMEEIRSFWFKVVMYTCLLIVCLIVGTFVLGFIMAVAERISG